MAAAVGSYRGVVTFSPEQLCKHFDSQDTLTIERDRDVVADLIQESVDKQFGRPPTKSELNFCAKLILTDLDPQVVKSAVYGWVDDRLQYDEVMRRRAGIQHCRGERMGNVNPYSVTGPLRALKGVERPLTFKT